MEIMERALADLIGRRNVLEENIDQQRHVLAQAELELERTRRGITEMQAAIERVKKPAPARGRRTRTPRPATRRPPREGTITLQVLETVRALRADGTTASLGTITARSGVQPDRVRSTLMDLMRRGYVRRVSEGVYDVDSAPPIVEENEPPPPRFVKIRNGL